MILAQADTRSAATTGVSPSVSVILPNYNHGRWLPRSLAALAAQTGPSMEILVIDDGSTDNSIEVITDICRRHDFVRLIRHDVNRGPYAAVQSGIAAARGEFLLFAAADDFVLPGLLARGEAALRTYPDVAFFCAEVAVVDRDGRVIGCRPVVPPRFSSGYMSPAEVRGEIQRSDNWFVGTSAIYRRQFLAKINYFDESLGSLCDGLAMRLLAFRHGFYFDSEVLAVWRIDPESLSARTSLSMSEGRRVIEVSARWISEHFPADVRDAYRGLFERRLRFNMARHCVVARGRHLDTDIIGDLLEASPSKRSLVRLLARLPFVGPTLILAVMTLQLRPMSLTAFLRSWWRRVTRRRERMIVEDGVMRAYHPGLA